MAYKKNGKKKPRKNGNHLLCCCLLHSQPSREMFVQLHGMTALLQLLYAAAVNCCHNTYVRGTQRMPQARLRATRLALPPNPSTAPASSAQPKSVHSPTKCHWDPRAEQPLCTLCYSDNNCSDVSYWALSLSLYQL